ncbi:hypothetical protein ON010_g10331 [Phytophthora cinnamomi]|nr:hypothetical protein ON010_g10331 [Phytophthora cinnamomi]
MTNAAQCTIRVVQPRPASRGSWPAKDSARCSRYCQSPPEDDGRGDDQEGPAQPAGRGPGAPRRAGPADLRGQEERGAGQGAAGGGRRVRLVHPHAQAGARQDVAQAHSDDEDKKRIKEALAKDPVAGVTKVMTVKKLRKNFSRFEDKRALAAAYDMFLADDRVLPYLKGHLGTKFFSKKKQPIAVRVSRKSVAASVRLASRRTALHVSAGVCNNVKVARLDMTPEQIVDNVMVAMNSCASLVPKGWNGVQSISVKTSDSVALPVYNALATLAKLPPVGKTANLKKRKLEEFVAELVSGAMLMATLVAGLARELLARLVGRAAAASGRDHADIVPGVAARDSELGQRGLVVGAVAEHAVVAAGQLA